MSKKFDQSKVAAQMTNEIYSSVCGGDTRSDNQIASSQAQYEPTSKAEIKAMKFSEAIKETKPNQGPRANTPSAMAAKKGD